MHYLANAPGLEHFLAKKYSCLEGGRGNIYLYLYMYHTFLLTCYQSAHLLSKGSTEGLHLLI